MNEYEQAFQVGAYKALIKMFIDKSKDLINEDDEITRSISEKNLQLLINQAEETLQKYENNG
jgi:hypothetical protein